VKTPELPNKATATTEREIPSGVSCGIPKIDMSRRYDCQTIDGRDLADKLARFSESDEGKRLIAENEAAQAKQAQLAEKKPPKPKSANPFKRVSFKIDGATFAKYYSHQPTPEPLENLYDTQTLKRLFAPQNPDGTPKKLFAWRSWMWMPAALLVALSFIVGGYLAMAPKKQVSAKAPLPSTTELVIGHDNAVNTERNSASPLPSTETLALSPDQSVTAEKPVTSRIKPPIANGTKPVTRADLKPNSKSDSSTIHPKIATTSKANDSGAATPYAKTLFTPAD
jgi:hypothetical protein